LREQVNACVQSGADEECFLSINQMQILLQEEQAVIQFKLNKFKENSIINKQARQVEEVKEDIQVEEGPDGEVQDKKDSNQRK
jgi:hypothetical protein